jgi:hypothetical protein
MTKLLGCIAAAVCVTVLGRLAALAQEAPEQLAIAMYAPAAAFPDSTARLAYVQGLARAVQQRSGVPATGKLYVRLGDLLAAKPDFAIIDGQCLAAKAPGPILAAAVAGGDTGQAWGLYTRGGESLASLKGKKLVYVKTGCRDGDFLDNAMLDGELRTSVYFGALVEKPDVAGAVATVRDYKAADAVFAPAGQARGLSKVYDAGTVPNAGFVALKAFPGATLDSVRGAVLGYGGGGGIDGWRAVAPAAYGGLGGRMAARAKRPVFAVPDVVRLDDQDVLVLPPARYEQATVKQHFWEPTAGAE